MVWPALMVLTSAGLILLLAVATLRFAMFDGERGRAVFTEHRRAHAIGRRTAHDDRAVLFDVLGGAALGRE